MSVTQRQVQSVFRELTKAFSEDQEALRAIEILKTRIEEQKLFVKEASNSVGSNNFPLPQELLTNPQAFAIFADGACRGNPGPGAWGVVAQNAQGDVIFESNGLDLSTTNNRMELEGAIQSMERLLDHFKEKGMEPAPTFLYSDSKYVIEGLEKWVPGWKNRGWKKADGKAPENLELWQHLDFIKAKFTHIEFRWIKGHAGHPQNEHCDRLANEALNQSGF